MKSIFNNFLMFLTAAVICSSVLYAQDDAGNTEDNDGKPEAPFKSIFMDIGGGGPAGLSAAVGFRYSFASLSIGIAGFAKDIPNYSTNTYGVQINPSSALPSGYTEDRYTALIVTGDAAFYLDYFKPVTLFGSIGFYSAQDSVLAKKITSDERYLWKTENKSGLCFGVGAVYPIADMIEIGAGYHTKRGVFARLTYYWY